MLHEATAWQPLLLFQDLIDVLNKLREKNVSGDYYIVEAWWDLIIYDLLQLNESLSRKFTN